MDDIQMAQVEAAEQAVVDRLRRKGLLPNEEQPASASNPIRKLTQPELNHLLELLESRKQEGSYFGPRDQYYARTNRLIQWCSDQVKGGKR